MSVLKTWNNGEWQHVYTTLDLPDESIPTSKISGLADVATSGDYNDLIDVPSTFPPSTHNHDDRYYTESETDSLISAKYTKPSAGIPKTDLEDAVQTSLGLADTALQEHQDISGKEDKANKVTSWSSTTTDTHYPSEKLVKSALDGKANSSHTHTKSQITDLSSETWTFTLDDDSTVTKEVVLWTS